MDEQTYYRLSIKGLSIDETGRFLLIRESDGRWELPGGGLDHGEDPIDGLRREVHEETGLVITTVSQTPKYFITSPRVDSNRHTANVIYEINLKDLNFIPSEECEELRYCSIEEARQLKLFPNVQKFLDVYNQNNHIG